jgi:hypothetical protein
VRPSVSSALSPLSPFPICCFTGDRTNGPTATGLWATGLLGLPDPRGPLPHGPAGAPGGNRTTGPTDPPALQATQDRLDPLVPPDLQARPALFPDRPGPQGRQDLPVIRTHRSTRSHRAYRIIRLAGDTGPTGPRGPRGRQDPQAQPAPYRADRTDRRYRTHRPTGPAGAASTVTGPTGPTGDTDPRADRRHRAHGPASAGAIIPFASGLPVSLTTILGGLVGTRV